MNAVVKSPNGIRSWTDAQRAEQAAKLHARKIWLKSTGPRTPEGKAISCLNALKHGGTSRPAKAFMAHFRNYYALLRASFQKKRELLQIQKNELIASSRITTPQLTDFESKMGFPENRSTAYVWVREQRKRRARPFAGQKTIIDP